MQSPVPDDIPGDCNAFDESVFHKVQLRVLDASSSDVAALEEILGDAIQQVYFLRDAIDSGIPIARAIAVQRANAWLALFEPLE